MIKRSVYQNDTLSQTMEWDERKQTLTVVTYEGGKEICKIIIEGCQSYTEALKIYRI